MEITYKARSYFVQKIEQETEEALASRSWFIIKALDPSTSVVSAISNSNPFPFSNPNSNPNPFPNPNSNTNLSTHGPNFTSDVPITFDEAVLLSKYWYYVRKYDCKYNQSIMEKIMKVEKLLYV